jgi:hypothetical protein
MSKAKIHPVAFGLSFGIVSGLSAFGVGLFMQIFMNGKPIAAVVGQFYLGYNPSYYNSAVGSVIGLVGGFVGGFIVAWLYNTLIELLTKFGLKWD